MEKFFNLDTEKFDRESRVNFGNQYNSIIEKYKLSDEMVMQLFSGAIFQIQDEMFPDNHCDSIPDNGCVSLNFMFDNEGEFDNFLHKSLDDFINSTTLKGFEDCEDIDIGIDKTNKYELENMKDSLSFFYHILIMSVFEQRAKAYFDGYYKYDVTPYAKTIFGDDIVKEAYIKHDLGVEEFNEYVYGIELGTEPKEDPLDNLELDGNILDKLTLEEKNAYVKDAIVNAIFESQPNKYTEDIEEDSTPYSMRLQIQDGMIVPPTKYPLIVEFTNGKVFKIARDNDGGVVSSTNDGYDEITFAEKMFDKKYFLIKDDKGRYSSPGLMGFEIKKVDEKFKWVYISCDCPINIYMTKENAQMNINYLKELNALSGFYEKKDWEIEELTHDEFNNINKNYIKTHGKDCDAFFYEYKEIDENCVNQYQKECEEISDKYGAYNS